MARAIGGVGIHADKNVETEWIDEEERIPECVDVCINAAIEPYGIGLHIPSECRVVVSAYLQGRLVQSARDGDPGGW